MVGLKCWLEGMIKNFMMLAVVYKMELVLKTLLVLTLLQKVTLLGPLTCYNTIQRESQPILHGETGARVKPHHAITTLKEDLKVI